MKIPVLVEEVGKRKWRTRIGSPFDLSAEGEYHGAAVRNLEALVRQKLQGGARLDEIDVPGTHPLLRAAGSIDPDDPMDQEYLQAIADYRRQKDEEDGKPPSEPAQPLNGASRGA